MKSRELKIRILSSGILGNTKATEVSKTGC